MLTTKQARENQEKYGFNELVEGKKKSTMQIFMEQFKDFLVIILIISAVISGILGDAESAIVIFVVITMNAILGTVQTVKAEQSLNSLKQLSAPEAKVARDGNIIQIPFAFILGLIFAYIDCKANSIIPSIIIHFINNLYSVIMDILQSQNIVTTRSFYIIYYSIFTAMLVFGVLAFLYIMKKDKNFLSISDTSNVVSLSLKEKISAGTATIVVILILETIIASVAL